MEKFKIAANKDHNKYGINSNDAIIEILKYKIIITTTEINNNKLITNAEQIFLSLKNTGIHAKFKINCITNAE